MRLTSPTEPRVAGSSPASATLQDAFNITVAVVKGYFVCVPYKLKPSTIVAPFSTDV